MPGVWKLWSPGAESLVTGSDGKALQSTETGLCPQQGLAGAEPMVMGLVRGTGTPRS